MGSAVDNAGLTAELEALRAAGLGGVEITPIYGVMGAEQKFIPYLSDDWMRALGDTLHEAARLDLGVDMATGTGWPFGGTWVGETDACRSLAHRTWTLQGGSRLTEPVQFEQPPFVRAIGKQIAIDELKQPVEANANLQALALEQIRFRKQLPLLALIAYRGSDGQRLQPIGQSGRASAIVDLTARVGADGTLDWTAPDGTWILYGVFLGWHGKLVERAAPGGEGNVVDHFSRDAIQHYLQRFDRAFAARPPRGIRAFFNDSYEVDDASGQADGTAALFREFEKRRGYDLKEHLPDLFDGEGDADTATRVLADYRQTVSDLLLDSFTTEWRAWARRHGAIVRNQAHGSPASLLDLYAASDIPETEGTEIQRARWATSAAHVAGRRLVSAETATWLDEHFRARLSDIRAAINRFFVAGVNHIVYHGTAYSPPEEPWPGWQFYASVEFNARNSWWTDFQALNTYVSRVQSFLQTGAPDADVLLYFPLYDSLAIRGSGLLKHFGDANPPREGTRFESAAGTLQRRGFTFDFVSDRQILALRADRGRLVTSGGASYRTLVVPGSHYIPLDTFEAIASLVRGGASVVLFDGMPEDVAGLGDLEAHRSRFRETRDAIRLTGSSDAVSESQLGRGRILIGNDLERVLARAGISREPLVDRNLQFVRRRVDDGRIYFIANNPERGFDEWVALDDRSPGATLFDPDTGAYGDGQVRRSAGGTLEVHLTLAPGASVIVVTTSERTAAKFPSWTPGGDPIELRGPWTLRFSSGGPSLPRERALTNLQSWTAFGDEEKAFSGTAVYSITLPAPRRADVSAWRLDLGDVRETARVRLNGADLGTVLGPSFQLVVNRARLQASNVLEIYVSNLMANRIASLDRAGVRWRKFYNVNFPARFPQNRGADGLFSAASWDPLESGLLGPVTLTALGEGR
jgi:glycosyl hydrolase family 106( putative alpha-L-rhamnosidase)